jgi:hypothetical protein
MNKNKNGISGRGSRRPSQDYFLFAALNSSSAIMHAAPAASMACLSPDFVATFKAREVLAHLALRARYAFSALAAVS